MIKYIRNFCIIAHIDHGKSTFSDRFIEICNKKKLKNNQQRILDTMDLEKEKGITIKSQCVNLKFKYKNKKYKLNLIDTPGHIDFSYEVLRSLYTCEGALLLIDVTKGIQAQTLFNYNRAKKLKLKILIIINKIDINKSNIKNIKEQIKSILKIKDKIFICSSKTGYGIKNIIKNIIKKIPHPKGNIKNSLSILIIDSYFNNYLGTFFLIKIKNGYLRKKDNINILNNKKKKYNIKNILIYKPKKKKINKLKCGEIAWICCNIKKIKNNLIGKIINENNNKNYFKKSKPQIFANIFPKKNNDFKNLKTSIKKLSLNDSSITYKLINLKLLGFGFKCGFLGTFHIEIIKERLKREYNIYIIITNPTIKFKITIKNKKNIYINDINKLPNFNKIKNIKEPFVKLNIIIPKKYIGKIINLCISKRGKLINIIYFKKNILLKYKIPLLEIITNFSNEIKSITKGYANFNYKFYKYIKSNIVILKVIINNSIINELSTLIHINNIHKEGQRRLNIIKNNIKKQLFDIIIQISCNNKIILKINIKALRKNVIAKCYGGDITRKKKLIQKQKIGKKKMKKIGNIFLSSKIFSNILKIK